MSERILILEPQDYSAKALSLYASKAEVESGASSKPEEVKCLVVRLGQFLGPEFLARFPQLNTIVTPTTGLNHIDLDYCLEKGIRVLSLRDRMQALDRITSTSELCFGLLISIVRSIPQAVDSVRDGEWNRNMFLGRQLSGMSLGLVGFGRIARHMSGYAKAVGMKVSAFDPFVSDNVFSQFGVVRSKDLKSLVSCNEVVSLHASYSKENEKMFNEEVFNCFSSGSYFINTARGELVDEQALVQSLEKGRLQAAAVDVICAEQSHRTSSPILEYAKSHPNLLVTPHIGGASKDAMRVTEEIMAEFYVNGGGGT